MAKGPQEKLEESRQRGYDEADSIAQEISAAVDAGHADKDIIGDTNARTATSLPLDSVPAEPKLGTPETADENMFSSKPAKD